MLGKTLCREDETSYVVQYEKRKIQECADTLYNFANVFLIEEKEEEKENDRQSLFFKKRLVENRVLMADHLKEMAKIMKERAEESIKIIRLGERREKQIAKLLLMEGLILEDIYLLEKGNIRKEVVIRLYQSNTYGKSRFYSTEEVAAFLSVFLNMRLVPAFRTPFFILDKPAEFHFDEDTKYMVLTGFSKAVKEGEKISGDNFSFLETEDRKFYGILSDGMGSGEKACRDSETVIEMAEKFLESGFSKELTAQIINDSFIIQGEGKNMSTLDFCGIDLYTAKAQFLKVGAAYGFLKRDSYVEKIPSISLPLGVFHSMEMNHLEKQLLDGDYIFLFSDGVIDYFFGEEGENFLKELIMEIPYKRPAEMASYIMKHAISAGKGKIKDDMTVLVLGIWENENCRKDSENREFV